MLLRILVIALASLCTGCDHPVSVIRDIPAPDGRIKAVIFTSHAGGVASDLHTSVSIIPVTRAEPSWPPNVFTATHGAEDSPAADFFGPTVTVRWIDSRTLEVIHDPRASVLRQYTEVRGVRVIFRTDEQENRPSRGRAGNGPSAGRNE